MKRKPYTRTLVCDRCGNREQWEVRGGPKEIAGYCAHCLAGMILEAYEKKRKEKQCS